MDKYALLDYGDELKVKPAKSYWNVSGAVFRQGAYAEILYIGSKAMCDVLKSVEEKKRRMVENSELLYDACAYGSTNILGSGHYLLRAAAKELMKSDIPMHQNLGQQLIRKAELEERALAKVRGEK
jgi:hypothetical protein